MSDNDDKRCKHAFVLMETKKHDTCSGYNQKFTRIDLFYCSKCLEIKEVKRVDYSRDTPDWY